MGEVRSSGHEPLTEEAIPRVGLTHREVKTVPGNAEKALRTVIILLLFGNA